MSRHDPHHPLPVRVLLRLPLLVRLRAVLFMHNFQEPARHFLHHAVRVAAVPTDGGPLALLDDLLEQPCSRQGVHFGRQDALQKGLSELGGDQHAGTFLAHALQQGQGVLEVSGMKDGNLQLNETKVTGTIRQPFVARFAQAGLVADPQAGIHASVGSRVADGHLKQDATADLHLRHLLDFFGGHGAELDLGDLFGRIARGDDEFALTGGHGCGALRKG